MRNKVLGLGATGTVGLPTVKALLAKGEKVKAASRGGQPVAEAAGVVFDYGKPETFDVAFEGVDRAFVMLPAGSVDPERLVLPVIEYAIARKVKVVFQSVFGVDADEANPYRQVEIALEKSRTSYVILRPNWFADNFHKSWRAGIEQGQMALPAGAGRSSFIDARDIAASAAAVLTNDAFDRTAFNLTGPEALSYADAALILSEVIGKPVAYSPIDDATFISMATASGVPLDYANFLAAIFYPVREGWTATVTDDVESLTGTTPHSLRAYARDHAADFKT